MEFVKRLIYCIVFLLLPFSAYAQQEKEEPEDSIVTLISSQTAQLLEIDGQDIRKVVGNPARFLHNNTYLLCDTALWNVDTGIIDAIGNVQIIQNDTELNSDRMVYYIDRDLAEFRGSVVQLRDKDNNILRTRNLDYNTKDSVAVFRNGGSMKDKDGQIIESITGMYESKIKLFTFTEDVNMFTDSIFVKTSLLKYESDRNLATFGAGTDAWKDKNMLSADAGWYDRGREVFFFRRNVHVMSDVQEGWSDSLYFYRNTMDVDMLGNAQVTDTTRNVSGVAGKISYVDSLSEVTMTRKPAVIAETEEETGRDTVYFGADTLIYYTVRMCDIDTVLVNEAAKRLAAMDVDPVSEFRRKAAAEAAKAAEEAAKNDPNRPPAKPGAQKSGTSAAAPEKKEEKPAAAPAPATPSPAVQKDTVAAAPAAADSSSVSVPPGPLAAAADSVSVTPDSTMTVPAVPDVAPADSTTEVAAPVTVAADTLSADGGIVAAADSVAMPEPDTTKIGFVKAVRNVKIYRKTMQITCDSLEYCDLDSIARLFKQPFIWNEVTQQYVADSVFALVRGSRMEKVSLMSNAFVHNQEDSIHYDQIRSTEMMAYFDENSQLRRFDALGGASALFYLEENDALATVNKKDSKMLSAIFVDGSINRIYYFDTAKSDAYPVAQMTAEDQMLKGFCWQPEKRPADRYAVTPMELRTTQRPYYSSRPRARFVQTGIYFPGYIDDIYTQIEARDSLNRVRDRERRIMEQDRERREQFIKDSLAIAKLDSIAVADSVALADSLAIVADSLAVADSISVADSIRQAAIADSLASVVPTKAQLKEQARKEREEKKAARLAEKEKRWADKDQADADKAKAKEEKKKEKLRSRKLKMLIAAHEEAMRDSARLEKYKEKYLLKAEKKKAREEKRAARRKIKPGPPPESGEAVLPEKNEEEL